MAVIWSNEGDIELSDLREICAERCGKCHARTTMVTFLSRMEEKGYIRRYRKGRYAYCSASVTQEEYLKEKMNCIKENFQLSDEQLIGIISNK
jgi:predicted transcriptional regulator